MLLGYDIEMGHVTEHILELYILDVAALPGDIRLSVTNHLAGCGACSNLAESIRMFYALLRQEPPPSSGTVDRVMRIAMPGPRVITLTPHQAAPRVGNADYLHSMVLAAAGRDQEAVDQTICTLVNREQHVILRVRREGAESIRFFLHAESPALLDGALVSVPSMDLHCVLDGRGQCAVPWTGTMGPDDWSLVQAIVRTPLCAREITAEALARGCAFAVEGTSVTVAQTGSSVTVTVHDSPRIHPSICVVAAGNLLPMVALFEGGIARIAVGSMLPRMILRLYE
jgi:hypothetical protein